jgi:transportin-1
MIRIYSSPQRLEALGKIPDFANYLVYILTQMSNEETTVRSVSGLILKNHLAQMGDQVPAESIEYVKSVIIPALSLQEDILRRTATQVIAMLMAILLPNNWLDGLSRLMQLIESNNIDEAEVSSKKNITSKQGLTFLFPLSGSIQYICQDLRRHTPSTGNV